MMQSWKCVRGREMERGDFPNRDGKVFLMKINEFE